jgi:hypothetical protein
MLSAVTSWMGRLDVTNMAECFIALLHFVRPLRMGRLEVQHVGMLMGVCWQTSLNGTESYQHEAMFYSASAFQRLLLDGTRLE